MLLELIGIGMNHFKPGIEAEARTASVLFPERADLLRYEESLRLEEQFCLATEGMSVCTVCMWLKAARLACSIDVSRSLLCCYRAPLIVNAPQGATTTRHKNGQRTAVREKSLWRWRVWSKQEKVCFS
jgi:hypothetical protein